MLQTLASVDMENLPVVIRFLLQSVTAADAQEVTQAKARVGWGMLPLRYGGTEFYWSMLLLSYSVTCGRGIMRLSYVGTC